MTAQLGSGVDGLSPAVRSINLERDLGTLSEQFVTTGRVLEVSRRILQGLLAETGSRAWTVTGPYGAGKSALGLFLSALLSGEGDPARMIAGQLMETGAQTLDPVIRSVRQASGVEPTGFLVAAVTCRREPVAGALLRALETGARRAWRRMPREVGVALEHAEKLAKAKSSDLPGGVAELFTVLRRHRPILLLVDELGKVLEYSADGGNGGDLFILQELAESCASAEGLRSVFVTFQHLSFGDYLSAAPAELRRDLGKVQGRFEEVAYIPSRSDTYRLIEASIGASHDLLQPSQSAKTWLGATAKAVSVASGLGDDLTASQALNSHPLHPVALAVLPELATRFAQNDRTVMGLLTSRGEGSLTSFTTTRTGKRGEDLYGLADLYQFFLESSGSVVAGSNDARKWFEVQRRVADSIDLDPLQVECMKAIAVLNLASSGSKFKASSALVMAALDRPGLTKEDRARRQAVPKQLEALGLITYRKSSDEYRVWWGTDFDVAGGVEARVERLGGTSLDELVSRVVTLPPVVASRFSQQTGYLRFFETIFADRARDPLAPSADGRVVYVFGDTIPVIHPDERSQVVLRLPHSETLRRHALEAVACGDLLVDEAARLSSDWVARNELLHREAAVVGNCLETLAALVSDRTATATAHWGGREIELSLAQGLSALVSNACELTYPRAAVVQNEMIARRELSSQGAKARRELIEAMIRNEREPLLGIFGYGPERAIYEAVLAAPGIHALRRETWSFGPPKRGSDYVPVWNAIKGAVSQTETQVTVADVDRLLQAPPYGVPPAVIPVLLVAVLLAQFDGLAIYQDGTYQASLTPELTERLVKTPSRFSVRKIRLRPNHEEWVAALRPDSRAGARTFRRNSTILGAVAPLLTRVRALPEWSLRTKSLSDSAVAVRTVLLNSVEPDDLLLNHLPRALGGDSRIADSAALAAQLETCLRELEGAYPAMLHSLVDEVADAFGLPPNGVLREDLRTRARHLSSEVIEPRLASFLWIARDDSLDDEDWLQALAMNIGDRPPASWKDEDRDRFRLNVRQLGATFQRIEALHFERRQGSLYGVDARRVTVTAPDGTETSRVVWLDEAATAAVAFIAEGAAAQADLLLGSSSGPALVAAIIALSTNQAIESHRTASGGHVSKARKVVGKR